MKKLLATLLGLALASFALAGCNSADTPPKVDGPPPPPTYKVEFQAHYVFDRYADITTSGESLIKTEVDKDKYTGYASGAGKYDSFYVQEWGLGEETFYFIAHVNQKSNSNKIDVGFDALDSEEPQLYLLDEPDQVTDWRHIELVLTVLAKDRLDIRTQSNDWAYWFDDIELINGKGQATFSFRGDDVAITSDTTLEVTITVTKV
ncbi:MAG: hypothetical protein LBE83_09400 [Propionibacteriaceae bacterium]|nr:hypothetical protein [Propionibacteriaceae bacterium]